MDRCKCYLCERLCFCESQPYNECIYRKQRSFGMRENRDYEQACTRLAVKFGKKHGWPFEGWVGCFDPKKNNWHEGAGGWAQYNGDDVVSMEDLRADLMMDAHPDAYSAYRDEQMEEYYAAEREEREPQYVNYRNWLMGARHNMEDSTPEWKELQARKLEEAKKRCEEAKRELMEQLQRNADDLLTGSDGLY